MQKQRLLMKLLETAGGIRQAQRSERMHHGEGMCHGEEMPCRPPAHGKMSPIAQSVLCLLLHEGNLNQRTIAKYMGVSGQAISEIVKKMEAHGITERKQGEQNNENIISLTPAGMQKAQEIDRKVLTQAEGLFVDFSEAEMETLQVLLEKIQQNHQAMG